MFNRAFLGLRGNITISGGPLTYIAFLFEHNSSSMIIRINQHLCSWGRTIEHTNHNKNQALQYKLQSSRTIVKHHIGGHQVQEVLPHLKHPTNIVKKSFFLKKTYFCYYVTTVPKRRTYHIQISCKCLSRKVDQGDLNKYKLEEKDQRHMTSSHHTRITSKNPQH